jgi:hypothetical protein
VIIELPVGKKIRFDEQLIDAYQPFELKGLDDDGIKKERQAFDYEPGVEYIMTENGLEKFGVGKEEGIKATDEII